MLLTVILIGFLLVIGRVLYMAVGAGVIVIPPPPPRKASKVFSIGLSRTGTTSITVALGRLGWKTYHALIHLAQYPKLGEVGGQARAVKRWSDAFDAFTDIPTSTVYSELAELYPDAKFVLTTRDPDAWAKSMVSFAPKTLVRSAIENSFFHTGGLFRAIYGEDWQQNSFEDWRQIYIDYQQGVQEYFADEQGRLLQLNVTGGEGWQQLAEFLGVEPEEGAFPHVDVMDLTFGLQLREQFGNIFAWLRYALRGGRREARAVERS
jgi:hypothetical protein